MYLCCSIDHPMIILALIVWVFTGLRLLVAVSNLLMRQWLQPAVPVDKKLISVLIPARNEQKNIAMLLEDIILQDYDQWEAIVYDDLSEDKTAEIAGSFTSKDRRIKLVKGKELPEGWLGKNHACHQLVKHAGGNILLFVDADVRMKTTLLSNAVAHIEKHRLHMLSVFPQQIMQTWGERLIVPLMNWILVSLLPLILTRVSRFPSLSAANGQFLMVDAETYKKHMFHRIFRNSVAEDIAIARYMKRSGLRIHTILSGGQVQCRMYTSFAEAVNGFSKNVMAFFGSSPLTGILFTAITSCGAVPVYLAMGTFQAVLLLGTTLLIRIIVAAASKQHIAHNLITAPVQQLSLIILIIKSIHNMIYKKNKWKGRIISG